MQNWVSKFIFKENIKPRHKIHQVTVAIDRVGNDRLKSLDLAFVP